MSRDSTLIVRDYRNNIDHLTDLHQLFILYNNDKTIMMGPVVYKNSTDDTRWRLSFHLLLSPKFESRIEGVSHKVDETVNGWEDSVGRSILGVK